MCATICVPLRLVSANILYWLGVLTVLFSCYQAHAVTAQRAASDQLVLTWDSSPDPVGGYYFYYGQSSGNYSTKIDVGNQTSYTPIGLDEGVTYYFATTAYDPTGTLESIFSNEVIYTTGISVSLIADFSATPTSGTAPLTVNFTDTSAGEITAWAWDFGEGGASTAQNPTHTYSTEGTYSVTLTASGPAGSDTETKTNLISVTTLPPPSPETDFSADPTSGNAPLTVNFTDASTGEITSRVWDFGDSGSSSTTNPSHTYSTEGAYTVTLTTTGPGGSDSKIYTDFITVTESAPGQITLAWNSNPEPVGGYYLYYGQSSGNYTTQVDVGNQTTYTLFGLIEGTTYYLAVTAYDATRTLESGFSDEISHTIGSSVNLTANFNATPTSGTAPMTVNFTDTSTGDASAWSWDFGDGSATSTAQNSIHTYTTEGTYSVTLTASGPDGSDIETKTNLISVTALPPPPPETDFSADPTSGNAPLTVNFTDASTGEIASRVWDFGDGSSSTATNPSHTYSTEGAYTVTLTTTGPGGSDSKIYTDFIFVADNPTVPPSGVVESRVSSSTDDAEERQNNGDMYLSSSDLELIDDGSAGEQLVGMRFQNLAIPQGAAITAAYIEFETDETSGGSTSLIFHGEASDDAITFGNSDFDISSRPTTGVSVAWNDIPAWNVVSEKHRTPNLAPIVQEIINRSGWQSGNSMVFIVSGSGARTAEAYNGEADNAPLLRVEYALDSSLEADFSADPTSGNAPLTVNFTDASTGEITSRVWNFGDGSSSTATNPSHTYSTEGAYTVTLTTTGPGGSDSKIYTDFITVTESAPGQITLTWNSNPDPVGGYYLYYGQSSGNYTTQVDVGNQTTYTLFGLIEGTTYYFAVTAYDVTRTLESGFSDEISHTIGSSVNLTANFSATPTSGTAPMTVNFTDTSTGDASAWSWDFGDGSATSTAQNPIHTYTTEGTYSVTLTASGPDGSDTETKTNLISVTALPPPPPEADFSADPTSGNAPLTVNFTDASTGEITSRVWDFGDGSSSTATNPSHTYSTEGAYTVTLTATGPGGSDSKIYVDFITVTESAPGQITLAWDASPDPALGGYYLYYGESSGNYTTQVDVGNQTIYTLFGLTEGTTYYLAVTAYDTTRTIESDFTNEASHTAGASVSLDADFSADPTSGNVPLTVNFTDASAGEITSRVWDFGDGSATSTAQNPIHTYTTEGTYSVTLTASGPDGSDTETKTNLISVTALPPPPPETDFSADPTSGNAPLTVNFTDTSTGEIASRVWDFGDGSSSTATNPSHTYSTEGAYTVTLTTTGPGGSDSKIYTDFIFVADNPTVPPSGVVESRVSSSTDDAEERQNNGDMYLSSSDLELIDDGSAGEQLVGMRFQNLAIPQGAAITAAYIEFETDETSGGSTSLIFHGEASDDAITFGNSDFDISSRPTTGVSVAWNDIPAWNVVSEKHRTPNLAPIVQEIINRSGWQSGNSMVFIVSGSGARTAEAYNGEADNAPLLRVEYALDSSLEADFSADPTSGNAPLTVNFTDASTGEITSRVWNFGDGTGSNSTSPDNVYSIPGEYTVTLTVNGPGGSDTTNQIIIVTETPPPPEAPVADFSANQISDTPPLMVSFSDQSTGQIDSRLWDFGNGGESSGSEATITYAEPGDYTVSLTVTGPGGSDTDTQTITVTEAPPPPKAPTADFSADPISGAAPLDVSFTDLSSGQISSWSWDFGNDTQSSVVNPATTYTTPGEYIVSLTVTGPGGDDTITQLITVTETPLEEALVEAGEIVVDGNGACVDFKHLFIDPVVVAKPASLNDLRPAVVRIGEVDSEGFCLWIQEWDYLAGDTPHGPETVSYLVVERGNHILEDGTMIEAGQTEATDETFKRVNFEQQFPTIPIVIALVTTINELDAVTVRMKRITTKNFRVKMQEQESNANVHATETISYIAWEASSGTVDGINFEVDRTEKVVTHNMHTIFFQEPFMDDIPFFLADMQTQSGGDTANLRWQNIDEYGVEVKIAEEQSQDSEMAHTAAESVGYMSFAPAVTP